MRSRLVLLLGAVCLLFSAGSAMAQGGELVSAEWGVRGARVDVTANVRGLIHDGILNFEVTRFVLGIDPAPHQVKDLLIRVRHRDGQVEEFRYPERSVVNLELDRHVEAEREHWRDHDGDRDRDYDRDRDDYRDHDRGPRLRILQASYGAEGQFVDVTDALQNRVADGRLFMHVDNYNLGVDPLPGHHKVLRIVYEFHGDQRSVVVDEKTDLQLP